VALSLQELEMIREFRKLSDDVAKVDVTHPKAREELTKLGTSIRDVAVQHQIDVSPRELDALIR